MARSFIYALLVSAAFLAVANAATDVIMPTMSYDPSPDGRTSYSFTAYFTGTTLYYRVDSGSWITSTTTGTSGTNTSATISLTDITTNGGHCLETMDDQETNAFETTMYCWTIETFGTSSTNHGGCSFAYSLNSGATVTDSDSTGRDSLKITDFVEGTNSFDVMAYDMYGHSSDTNTFTWTTDTTCPSTEFTSAGKTAAGVTSEVTDPIRYFAYSSGDAAAVFKYSLDDGPWRVDTASDTLGSGTFTNTFTIDSCEATEHSFSVMAVDAVGNGCDAIKYTFTVEPIDTAVTLSNAATGTALSSGTGDFVFSATSGAGVTQAVKRYEYSLNGASWKNSDATLTLNDLPEGAHTLLVRAVSITTSFGICTDPTPASFSFSVDYSAPVTTIGAQYLPTSPTAENDFTMYGTVSDLNIKSDGTMYKLGDVEWYTPVPCAGCPDDTFAITLTDLVDGDYSLQVKSTDALGNAEAWTTVATWTVDSGAMTLDTLVVSGAPSPMLEGGSAMFVFGTTTAAPAVFYYALSDSEGMGPWNLADGSAVEFSDLAPGLYTLYAYAEDSVGNKDETPSTYTWTVYPQEMYDMYLGVAGYKSVESTPMAFQANDMEFVHDAM